MSLSFNLYQLNKASAPEWPQCDACLKILNFLMVKTGQSLKIQKFEHLAIQKFKD